VTEPLVSILIPTYNGERFLRNTLRSASVQTHRNIEIIVGDDASTDSTPQILAAAAANDPRVRVIRHEPNVGAWENPLSLLDAARGEYVKFLLHDDSLAPDCVRDLVRGIESEPGLTMAFSRRALMDQDGRLVPGHEFPTLSDRPGPMDGRQLGDLTLEECANVIGELTTVLFRRADVGPAELSQIVDGRRLEVLGDLSVWLRLLARGAAFYTPRTLSRFRIHPGQNGQTPRIQARGVLDWVLLIDWGVRHGFLADEQQQRRAHARTLQIAATQVAGLVEGQDCGPALEAVYLSTARLVELTGRATVDTSRPLLERAHAPEGLARLSREVDVQTRTFPVALAAPAAVEGEIAATVQAFRDVRDAGAANTFMLAVAPELVDQTIPLVEHALTQGPDVDIELVPTERPWTLVDGPWLAVTPPGASWQREKAAAVWTIDPLRTPVA